MRIGGACVSGAVDCGYIIEVASRVRMRVKVRVRARMKSLVRASIEDMGEG